MSKVKSYGFTDTPIEGVTSLTFARAILNIGKDYRVKSVTPGKEVILTNITGDRDHPQRIRISYAEVNNIYAGSGIEPSMFSPSKKGVSILVQVTDVITLTDSVDATFHIDYPVSYHFVIKVPADANVSADDIEAGLGRALSCLYDAGVSDNARLEALLRGSVLPKEL